MYFLKFLQGIPGLTWGSSLAVLIINVPTLGQAQSLTELSLIQDFRKNSIAAKSIDLQNAQALFDGNIVKEQYSSRLFGSVGRSVTNEPSSTPMQPIISPADQIAVGVQRNLPFGLQLQGSVFSNQISAADKSFERATQSGVRFQVEMDLWKNFLGSLDRAKLSSAESQVELAQIESKLSNKKLELGVRKIFWSLVAVEQSIDLSKQLLQSAEKQLKDANARRSAGVADAGEVARYKSQVQSRESAILLFEYEKSLLHQAIDNQVEGSRSATQKVDLGYAALQQKPVWMCLQKIESSTQPNDSDSLIDELIQVLDKDQVNRKLITSKHSDIDLTLQATLQSSGSGDGYNQSRNDFVKKHPSTRALAVKLGMPLGGESKDSQRALEKLQDQVLGARVSSLRQEQMSSFYSMAKALKLLNAGLKNQQDNSSNLAISYRETSRKYEQGRIPVSVLINEQDALFQSGLQEISLKRQIAHALLDYFTVFTEFDCEWNRIAQTGSQS